MNRWTLSLAAVLASSALIGSSAVEAKTTTKKKAPALTQVRVCPMSGTPVKGNGAGSTVVGKYKVYFC